jgi:hypothetical protein
MGKLLARIELHLAQKYLARLIEDIRFTDVTHYCFLI